jgi:hypothetical protein
VTLILLILADKNIKSVQICVIRVLRVPFSNSFLKAVVCYFTGEDGTRIALILLIHADKNIKSVQIRVIRVLRVPFSNLSFS